MAAALSITHCTHDSTIICGFRCWYYWHGTASSLSQYSLSSDATQRFGNSQNILGNTEAPLRAVTDITQQGTPVVAIAASKQPEYLAKKPRARPDRRSNWLETCKRTTNNANQVYIDLTKVDDDPVHGDKIGQRALPDLPCTSGTNKTYHGRRQRFLYPNYFTAISSRLGSPTVDGCRISPRSLSELSEIQSFKSRKYGIRGGRSGLESYHLPLQAPESYTCQSNNRSIIRRISKNTPVPDNPFYEATLQSGDGSSYSSEGDEKSRIERKQGTKAEWCQVLDSSEDSYNEAYGENSERDDDIWENVSSRNSMSSEPSLPTEHSHPTSPSQYSTSCINRKRKIIYSRPDIVTTTMQSWITHMFCLLDPFRNDHDCWLYPAPQRPVMQASGRPRALGHISRKFSWSDDLGSHALWLNFGIVWRIVNNKLTRRQKDGFINKSWHLSHLCGNWTCLNPLHATVEPGRINIGRNSCFAHRSGCNHQPPCLKDKKLSLGPDGKVVDLHANRLVGITLDTLEASDDFQMQYFEDDEADQRAKSAGKGWVSIRQV